MCGQPRRPLDELRDLWLEGGCLRTVTLEQQSSCALGRGAGEATERPSSCPRRGRRGRHWGQGVHWVAPSLEAGQRAPPSGAPPSRLPGVVAGGVGVPPHTPAAASGCLVCESQWPGWRAGASTGRDQRVGRGGGECVSFYRDRVGIDIADNVEAALACYQRVLQMRTRKALPWDCALTQKDLGEAYIDCVFGDRAANVEEALNCYRQALQVLTREATPRDCAVIQESLRNAYR